MSMRIGTDTPLPTVGAEQATREGAAAGVKSAAASDLVIDARERAEGSTGTLSFADMMPTPEHRALDRVVDATRASRAINPRVLRKLHRAEAGIERVATKIEFKVGIADKVYDARQLAQVAKAIEQSLDDDQDDSDPFYFGTSDTGHASASGNMIYLTPAQYKVLQKMGIQVTSGSSMSRSAVESLADQVSSDKWSGAASDLTAKAGLNTVSDNAAIAAGVIGTAGSSAGASAEVELSTPGAGDTAAISDAVLSMGCTAVAAFTNGGEGSSSWWPGAPTVSKVSSAQVGEAFSDAQQEVIAGIGAKAEVEGEGETGAGAATRDV